MSVWTGDHFACIRIVGRANLHSSIDFKSLVNELRGRGCARFILELSECSLMDSTFLGVLTGLGLRMGDLPGQKPIQLFNANPRITGLLENLGVLHLFALSNGPVVAPANAEQHDHVPAEVSKTALGQTSVEAHETLMRVNPANIPRFKDVAQFLAEDLRRED